MEYLFAIVCGLAPLVVGFALNRRFGQRPGRPPSDEQLPAVRAVELDTALTDQRPEAGELAVESGASNAESTSGPAERAQERTEERLELQQQVLVVQQAPAPAAILAATSTSTVEPNVVSLSEVRAKRLRAQPQALASVDASRAGPAKVQRYIDPEHFKRHSGVPGFLYLARNETRRQGLYKLGYSTQLPQSRMATLNEQIKGAVDFGIFRLVHAVPVGSSYDMEQALFEVLKTRRVVEKREFFFGPEQTFIRAMDALVRMPEDAGEGVNDFLSSNPWSEEGGVPRPELDDCDIPGRGDSSGGWVYLCENFWHEPNTFYYSVSKDSPQALVRRLNEDQRAMTSQIGFYRIVACRAVRSPDLVRRQAQALFAPFRLDTRKNFVRLPLAQARDIVEALDADAVGDETDVAASSPEVRDAAPEHSPNAAIAVSVVNRQRAHNSWMAWTKVCSGCGALLRYQGKIGEQAVVACPVCSWSAAVRLGAQQVFVQ